MLQAKSLFFSSRLSSINICYLLILCCLLWLQTAWGQLQLLNKITPIPIPIPREGGMETRRQMENKADKWSDRNNPSAGDRVSTGFVYLK